MKFTGKERDAETGLDYFGARYFSGAQGRFVLPDALDATLFRKGGAFDALLGNPQNWNKYQYAHNSPLAKTDLGGFLTVVVPGTNWNPADWNTGSRFVKNVRDTFHESVRILPWSGGNSRGARSEAAQMLRALVAGHTFDPGEHLNIVAHSHGGNIALEASRGIKHKIDVLVTLGTPVRDDYEADLKNVGVWISAFAPGDGIQVQGGHGDFFCYFQGECGPAGRTFPGATRNVNTRINAGPLESHSDLWRNRGAWAQVVQSLNEGAAHVCVASNGANTAACSIASGQ